MNFFDGQVFVLGNSSPIHDAMHRGKALYYGIQYNHSGRFSYRRDHGELYFAEGPHAFFTVPGHYYEYGNPPGEPRSHHFICSEGPRCRRYLESGLFAADREPPLSPVKEPERFLATLTAILRLMRRPGPMTTPRAILLYEDLLLQLFESEHETPQLPIHQEAFFTELVAAVTRAPEKIWDFRRAAKQSNLTETHFRRLFKRITGLPPQQFLIRQRLQLAAQLLLEKPQLPISVVAETCGIGNAYYFSRMFRKYYHVPPLEFRRSLAGYRNGLEC